MAQNESPHDFSAKYYLVEKHKITKPEGEHVEFEETYRDFWCTEIIDEAISSAFYYHSRIAKTEIPGAGDYLETIGTEGLKSMADSAYALCLANPTVSFGELRKMVGSHIQPLVDHAPTKTPPLQETTESLGEALTLHLEQKYSVPNPASLGKGEITDAQVADWRAAGAAVDAALTALNAQSTTTTVSLPDGMEMVFLNDKLELAYFMAKRCLSTGLGTQPVADYLGAVISSPAPDFCDKLPAFEAKMYGPTSETIGGDIPSASGAELIRSASRARMDAVGKGRNLEATQGIA